MAEKVGIRFKPCGKMYFFEVNGVDIQEGDCVVVESSFGVTIGRVVTRKMPIGEEERELKKVIRKANEEDVRKKEKNTELEKEARAFCNERIHARGLQMKLVCTEATLDKKRIIFYFTADGRIDFRELVKDLASKFKTRIEMRQIGVRDETKLVGGFGICGKEVCCRTFLTSFAPISIKMAKKQELVLNTNKLSGLCGRLMCCLNYEYDEEELRRLAPTKEEIKVLDEETVSEEYVTLSETNGSKDMEQERRKDEPPAKKAAKTSTGTPSVSTRTKGAPQDTAAVKGDERESSDKEKSRRKGKRRGRKYLKRRKKKKGS